MVRSNSLITKNDIKEPKRNPEGTVLETDVGELLEIEKWTEVQFTC